LSVRNEATIGLPALLSGFLGGDGITTSIRGNSLIYDPSILYCGERAMGTLWPYYRVVLESTGEALLLRSAGASRSRILGFEVDEHGRTLHLEDGAPRFQAVDRAGLREMIPLVLLGGQLVSAEPKARSARHGPG
jgi:hypothetical protein